VPRQLLLLQAWRSADRSIFLFPVGRSPKPGGGIQRDGGPPFRTVLPALDAASNILRKDSIRFRLHAETFSAGASPGGNLLRQPVDPSENPSLNKEVPRLQNSRYRIALVHSNPTRCFRTGAAPGQVKASRTASDPQDGPESSNNQTRTRMILRILIAKPLIGLCSGNRCSESKGVIDPREVERRCSSEKITALLDEDGEKGTQKKTHANRSQNGDDDVPGVTALLPLYYRQDGCGQAAGSKAFRKTDSNRSLIQPRQPSTEPQTQPGSTAAGKILLLNPW